LAVRPDQTPALGLFDDQGEVFLSLDTDTAADGKRPVSRGPK